MSTRARMRRELIRKQATGLATLSCFERQRNRLAWPHRRRGLASDGVRYADARNSVGQRFLYETKVRMVWGSFLIAAAALTTATRNGYNAQGVNLTSWLLCTNQYYSVRTHPLLRYPTPPRDRPHYCAIYRFPLTPRDCNIYHTILAVAMSCKGQLATLSLF